jgi:hypothetical protein
MRELTAPEPGYAYTIFDSDPSHRSEIRGHNLDVKARVPQVPNEILSSDLLTTHMGWIIRCDVKYLVAGHYRPYSFKVISTTSAWRNRDEHVSRRLGSRWMILVAHR